MPYRVRIELFDAQGAIQQRQQAGTRISNSPFDPLSLDTPTGLPYTHDLRVRQSTFAFDQAAALFSDWLTVDQPQPPKRLNPTADLFVPTSPVNALRPIRGPPLTIQPVFSPLRKLDYRFSQLSIEYRDMNSDESGSIDVGFGVLHLFRDKADVYQTDLPLAETSTGTASIEGNGCLLAVLSIPSVMTVSEFLLFVEPATEYIRQIRIIRDEGINRCMALIRFRAIEEAEQFLEEFNGKPFFAMLHDEVCQVVRVAQVEVRSSSTPPFTFPIGSELEEPPPMMPNAVELPTCVVCLERMDSNITGLITIPCQHSFHCTCLAKWTSGRCPVCRYTQSKIKTNTEVQPPIDALCEECGAESRLWMCLICGHVGCGRYAGRHAILHYDQLGHQYAMELESQRVWDYAADQYVHRLIQNTSDGRLVELPSTLSASSPEKGKGNLGPDAADSFAQSKLERMSEEFAHLLASQLESQRHYYFDKISDMKRSALAEVEELEKLLTEQKNKLAEKAALDDQNEAGSSRMAQERGQLEKRVEELEKAFLPMMEREKTKLSAKLEKATDLARVLQQELQAEKQVTKGLMDNVSKARTQLQAAHEQNASMKKEIADLQEQVNDLLANLSFKEQVDANPEWQGQNLGLSSPVPAAPSKPTSSKKKKKKPKKPPLLATAEEHSTEGEE